MNKIRAWRKIGCVLLATALLCGGFCLNSGAEPVAEDGTVADSTQTTPITGSLSAENDAFALYLNTEDMVFSVQNKANGAVWHSTPPTWSEDEYAVGLQRMEMPAWLNISYVNRFTGIEDKINSYTGCVMDEKFKLQEITDGFRVEFQFEEIGLTLPMEVTLTKSGLQVKVLTGQMVQTDSDILIESIAVLQYFGAGKRGDDGYLFVPDGSGALIRFDNGKTGASEYSMPVYGEEPSTYPEQSDLDLDSRKVSLPVYGIKNGDNAYMVILEQGAELATIKANVCRQVTDHANAYPQYQLYGKMEYSLANNKTMIYEQHNAELTDLSLSFRFLSGEDANYSGMARSYRTYLKEKELLPEQSGEQTAYLTLYGGVAKKVSVLGFVSDSIVPLTTVSEIETVLETLKQQGIDNVVVNYKNWNAQELVGKKVTKLDMAGTLGSIKDLSKLQSEEPIYTTLSSVLMHKQESFFGRYFNLACDISGMELRLNEYAVGLGTPLKGERKYLLTSLMLIDRAETLADNINKQGYRYLGLEDMGSLLYNDYRGEVDKRNDTRALLEESLSILDGATEQLLLSNPNQYALANASELINIPMGSSKHQLIDEEVPFEQLVLSGSLRYGSDAMNFMGDESLLKALETGSMLHYEGYYREAAIVKGTNLAHLCSGSLSLFAERMAKQYQELTNARKPVADSVLYAHEKVAEDVYAAVYENGVRIYVNYGDAAYSLANGKSVPAGGYLVEQEGK